jgi:hypothetical protein
MSQHIRACCFQLSIKRGVGMPVEERREDQETRGRGNARRGETRGSRGMVAVVRWIGSVRQGGFAFALRCFQMLSSGMSSSRVACVLAGHGSARAALLTLLWENPHEISPVELGLTPPFLLLLPSRLSRCSMPQSLACVGKT